MERRLNETIVFNGNTDFAELHEKVPANFAGTIIVNGDLFCEAVEDDGDKNLLSDLILPNADILVKGILAACSLEAHDVECETLRCNVGKLSGMVWINKDLVCHEIIVARDLCCEFAEAEYAAIGGDFHCIAHGIDLLEVVGDLNESE